MTNSMEGVLALFLFPVVDSGVQKMNQKLRAARRLDREEIPITVLVNRSIDSHPARRLFRPSVHRSPSVD